VSILSYKYLLTRVYIIVQVAVDKCLYYHTGMQNLGVLTADSYDETGRSRFHAFHPEFIKEGVYPDWYIQIDTHDAKKVHTF